MGQTLTAAEALSLRSLITPTEAGIASRILAKTTGGNLTLFAFDAGQGLTEHTSPFEAFVLVLDGTLRLTIGGKTLTAGAGTIVRLPANVPHALDAEDTVRLLLVMLRDEKSA
jgi:quercetin dioxygenase-like cupin family protein